MSLDVHAPPDRRTLSYAPQKLSPARSTFAVVMMLSALAFALRGSAIFVLHRWTQPNAIEHRALALSLIENGTFSFRDFGYAGPSSVQSPPYPFLLAMLFKMFGPDTPSAYIAAMLINSLAGAATVWLTWKLVRVLGGSPKASLIAAALV